nr:RING finger and transmembrane domain-containing protein 1-like [Tanacetum cinerariifolium]
MVRRQWSAFKLVLLMYYRNGRGHNFRRQGQMLTLVKYGLLLYRAFLPAPVWYRFFLNKEYGGLFSSLITGGIVVTNHHFSGINQARDQDTCFKQQQELGRFDVHWIGGGKVDVSGGLFSNTKFV